MPAAAAAPVLKLEVERCAGGNAVIVRCHGRLVAGDTLFITGCGRVV